MIQLTSKGEFEVSVPNSPAVIFNDLEEAYTFHCFIMEELQS